MAHRDLPRHLVIPTWDACPAPHDVRTLRALQRSDVGALSAERCLYDATCFASHCREQQECQTLL